MIMSHNDLDNMIILVNLYDKRWKIYNHVYYWEGCMIYPKLLQKGIDIFSPGHPLHKVVMNRQNKDKNLKFTIDIGELIRAYGISL
jgi:hypothetical protein